MIIQNLQTNQSTIVYAIILIVHKYYDEQKLTSLAQDPPIRKFPGMVGGLKARQLMLSSGGEVTSTSYKTKRRKTFTCEGTVFSQSSQRFIICNAFVLYSCLFTFMGLWLSVVAFPKTPVPPAPNPEVVPNKLIVL